MPLSSGEQLGHYKILSMIGKGGMGEVYLGTDTRLGRSVAIKVSSREFNDRFEREARAISALNHPNICTLYDIGPNYLVMELVEGEPLSKVIERGPLPLDKALTYGVQIVDALAAAHAKGVIHRDLKPGNIIITRNGVKVLDFGLAKLSTEKLSTDSAANIDTMTEPITRAGAILGTLYYMAPEQVEGKETDERSDIFSFGIVLYEMITGHRPFTGDTQAAVLASLLKDQPPPMNQRQPATPRALERVVRKCLEKKPEDRWHSARDLKPTLELIDLDALPTSLSSASVPIPVQMPAPTPKRGWLLPAIGATVLAAMAAVTAWALWFKSAPTAAMTRFQVALPENVNFSQYVSLSPDGRKLVFNSTGENGGLWVRDLDSLEWRQLPGTQNAASPFWSPDSKFLAFGVGTQLKKIDIAGGPPQTLTESAFPAGSGVWTRDGIIIFGGRGAGSLSKVSQAGGVATPVTTVDIARGEAFHALPTLLPDGKHFIYLRNGGAEVTGMYGGSLDAKPEEQSKERFLAGAFAASYVNGYLFFMRDNTLMGQPFDAGSLKVTGEPVPVVEGVATTGSIGVFSVSPSGALAYRSGASAGNYLLTWVDRQGKTLDTFGQNGFDGDVRLSPDGAHGVVRDAASNARGDLWTLDFARGIRTRFTFRQSAGSTGVWSPDGNRIAFSAGALMEILYEKASTGAGEEKELWKEPGKILYPTSWSRDGRILLYYTVNAGGGAADLFALPLEGDRKPVSLLSTKAAEGQPKFSPDMRWIAYSSNESGRTEIYVRPFIASPPSLGEGKWQISRDGGGSPRWRADGKEIVFDAPPIGSVKMAVEVNGSASAFQAGVPQRLFQNSGGAADIGWDITADGKRFLISLPPAQQSTQTPITVVLNWQAQLKK
jgi:eukaryotic-like serine/threonine-protein kinase